jgi:hypothetical protein
MAPATLLYAGACNLDRMVILAPGLLKKKKKSSVTTISLVQ